MDIDYVFKIDYGPMVEPIGSSFREHLMITEILPEMLAQVRKHFERDGINETKLIAQCKTFKDEYIIKNRIPTARDRKKIEKIYRQITPYRIMVEELSVIKGYLDHLPILRDIYEAMQAVYYIINKHYYSTVGNPNLGQRLRAIVDEYRKNQDIAPSTLPGFVDVSKEEAPVIPIPNNIESCTASCESTPAIFGHDDSKKDVKTTEAAAPTAYPADFSHMRSFTPNKAFDMSALYTFLVDEGVVDNIDERLFADCISHANVYELWEIAGRRRKRNLMQCLFKVLAQEWYPREWISTCASNMGSTVKKLTNPTTSGATGIFVDKLMHVLKPKKSD